MPRIDSHSAPVMTPMQWLQRLDAPDATISSLLMETYGTDQANLRKRRQLIRNAVERYQQAFGDDLIRVFRAPGRINLRGMHVDSHGGYLCLMTHQREVVLAASATQEDSCTFINLDKAYPPAQFHVGALSQHAAFTQSWSEFIRHPEIRQHVQQHQGDWRNYLEGAVMRIQRAFPDATLAGIRAVVASDLPAGAALSSSAALCIVVQEAVLACNGLTLSPADRIVAARDAEWYTGSRCGLSDQAAILLGQRDRILRIALLAEDYSIENAVYYPFPETLCVLVVNSYTQRSLSGAQQLAYTQNRFAYSVGLDLLRQHWREQGRADADRLDRFSRITPEALGNDIPLRQWLNTIPETIGLESLAETGSASQVQAAYQQYFGHLPTQMQPRQFQLRGPLLFGLAESERARLFCDLLETGDYARAGQYMTIGHAGDRVASSALEQGAMPPPDHDAEHQPLPMLPGSYGASSSALDALVDAALEAGALGACLTGAGMAGSVLALCRDGASESVAATIRAVLASPAYQTLSKRNDALDEQALSEAVLENVSSAGAGELKVAGC